MRIAFAGTPDSAVMPLLALIDSHHEVCFVITRPDAPSGRGRQLTQSPVAALAHERGIEILKPTHIAQIATRLAEVDLVVVVAYGALIPENLLAVPAHGWINVHYSLLPTWRGAAPVQHAIIHGDDISGVTIFQIDKGLDTGPVFATVTTSISSTVTATQLLGQLNQMASVLMEQVLDGIESDRISAQPQSSIDVSYAPKISTNDARIDWTLPALAISRRIRAMTDSPGAWTMLGDERIKMSPVKLRTDNVELRPGQVAVADKAILVGTGSHAVELTFIQRAGKTSTPASEWAHSLSDSAMLA